MFVNTYFFIVTNLCKKGEKRLRNLSAVPSCLSQKGRKRTEGRRRSVLFIRSISQPFFHRTLDLTEKAVLKILRK